MSKVYDVIIAGAGPVGLFLACELAMRQASVLVLERSSSPHSEWKKDPLGFRSLNTPSVETLYRRRLFNDLVDQSRRPSYPPKKPGFQPGGNFAGIMLDASKLDLARFKYRLPGPALFPGTTTIEKTESALALRAEALGVKIARGCGFESILAQDDTGVDVGTQDAQQFRAKWLVGCDGGRSSVRKAAGFEFTGTEATFTGYVAQCDLESFDKLKPGFQPTSSGMYIFRPADVVYLVDFDGGAFNREQEITAGHVQDVLRRVSGVSDVKVNQVHLASAFTDRAKQATAYRKGRVLLAGDAAHIHPPLGGLGLNVGLGDAMNLGWKLAATVRGGLALGNGNGNGEDKGKEFTLLDTYEEERHPIAASVLEWNRAQASALHPNPFGAALHATFRDVIRTADGANLFLDRVWGLSQRYEKVGGVGGHQLIGSSVPDFKIVADDKRLGEMMEHGKGLLVSMDARGDDARALRDLLVDGRYGDSVDFVSLTAEDNLGLSALLVRPDGVVAWLCEEESQADLESLRGSLERWFSV